MKLRKLNQEHAKNKSKKDGCNKKLKFVILNILLLLIYHYYFKSLQPLKTISIQGWDFYLWTAQFLQTFYKIDRFVIGPFKTSLWSRYLFKKISRNSRVLSIRFSFRVGDNVNYMENFGFSSQVETITRNCNIF